jgi:hypothetical protein
MNRIPVSTARLSDMLDGTSSDGSNRTNSYR